MYILMYKSCNTSSRLTAFFKLLNIIFQYIKLDFNSISIFTSPGIAQTMIMPGTGIPAGNTILLKI